MLTSWSSVDWFPQEYARLFFIGKGLLGLVATMLVVVHMSTTWDTVTNWGQRLRYLSLLSAISLITFASAEQSTDGIDVAYRHLGAVAVTLLIILAMVVSIRHDFRRPE